MEVKVSDLKVGDKVRLYPKGHAVAEIESVNPLVARVIECHDSKMIGKTISNVVMIRKVLYLAN